MLWSADCCTLRVALVTGLSLDANPRFLVHVVDDASGDNAWRTRNAAPATVERGPRCSTWPSIAGCDCACDHDHRQYARHHIKTKMPCQSPSCAPMASLQSGRKSALTVSAHRCARAEASRTDSVQPKRTRQTVHHLLTVSEREYFTECTPRYNVSASTVKRRSRCARRGGQGK